MITNMSELSEEVVRREGGKQSLSIAQIKEVLAIVSDIHYEHILSGGPHIGTMLLDNGQRRLKSGKSSK